MNRTPIWQPIHKIPELADFMEEHVGAFRDRLSMYRLAIGRPHAIDDETLLHSLQSQRQDREAAAVPEEQIARWMHARPTPAQRAELQRLTEEIARWRALCDDTIAVLEELQRQNATGERTDPLQALAFYIEVQCRPFHSLSAATRRGIPFCLPPEVTLSPRHDEDRLSYDFHHRILGFLGQLVVTRARGGTDVRAVPNDDGSADMVEQRLAYFTRLTSDILAVIDGTERGL